MSSRLQRLGIAVVMAASGVFACAASPALAAHSTPVVSCTNGQTYTVRTVFSHSSQNGGWGTAVIIEGGKGVGTPTAINGTVVDNMVGDQTVFTFSSVKGGGNASQNQQTTDCTITTIGTVADFVPPGIPLPPGVSGTDSATETIVATVVLKP